MRKHRLSSTILMFVVGLLALSAQPVALAAPALSATPSKLVVSVNAHQIGTDIHVRVITRPLSNDIGATNFEITTYPSDPDCASQTITSRDADRPNQWSVVLQCSSLVRNKSGTALRVQAFEQEFPDKSNSYQRDSGEAITPPVITTIYH